MLTSRLAMSRDPHALTFEALANPERRRMLDLVHDHPGIHPCRLW